jgi:hypothetical protein
VRPLINALEAYLKENIDEKVSVSAWNGKEQLPLFLLELYDLYQVNILDESCLLIGIINKAPGLDEIKKHMKVLHKNFNGPLVLSFKSITLFRRKSLIEHRIPFVVSNGQMYLPFLGLDLKKVTKDHIEPIEKFTNSAQLAFLYFLYNKELRINATELAKVLSVSNMTASRILNDLYTVDLLTYDISGKNGRTKTYKRIGDPDYYRQGCEYLKNPLNATVYVDKITEDCLVAGLEALSIISMINPPKRPVRAISKQKAKALNKHIIKNRDRIADQNLVELQIWNYDPELLSENNHVDIVSLTLSVSHINDERIDLALEGRLKGEPWYTV